MFAANCVAPSSIFSRTGIRFIQLTMMVIGLGAAASAQVTFTGTQSNQNFASQAIGVAGSAMSLNFNIPVGTTVGSVGVLTTGSANLDFTDAPGTTCVAKTYTSASACTVAVVFTPKVAGLRLGAVVFFSKASNAGTVLGSVPIYGMGTGAQIVFETGAVSTVDRTMHGVVGLSNPQNLTVDAAGNLYILDSMSNPTSYRMVKVASSGGTSTAVDPSVNGEALYLPSSIAIDGAGDVFIGDFARRVIEMPAGGGAATAIAPMVNNIPLNYPSGLAVDGVGDLYISDFINNRVLEVPANGGAAVAIDPTVNGQSLSDPHGLAVDGAGDLFIADLGNERVVEVSSAGVATAIVPVANGMGLRNPIDVAVNAAGDVFAADNVNHRVVEAGNAGGAALAIAPTIYQSGAGEMYAVKVDGSGNLYLVQGGLASGSNVVEEMQQSQNAAMSFPTFTNVNSVDNADGVQTVELVNIGNQATTWTAINFPADFAAVTGGANQCATAMTLNPGQSCEIAVEFSPLNAGSLNESITINEFGPNGIGVVQSINLTGTGEQQAALISPTPNNLVAGTSVLFSWTSSPGATGYYLSLGSTGPGSTDVYNSGRKPLTSITATGLPANGETIYVRLTTYFGSTQMHSDYTVIAASRAGLVSPAPGSLFAGSTATFNWTPGSGSSFSLWLGSTGVGSNNLYGSAGTTGSSMTVANIPTNGETIFVRLLTTFNGTQVHTDYTYQAATQAVLISPVANTSLAGSATTFVWTAGSDATSYSLWIGTTGVGSNNIYNSGQITSTSQSVTGLPINGKPVYVRLFTTLNGVPVHTDYSYTAM